MVVMVKVFKAKDGKIVIQDEALLENNYPSETDKNVYQLNILNLNTIGEETILDGSFITKRTKQYNELTGHTNLKKTSLFSESTLANYLQKIGIGNDLTAVK
jgi:hypothetical protein